MSCCVISITKMKIILRSSAVVVAAAAVITVITLLLNPAGGFYIYIQYCLKLPFSK